MIVLPGQALFRALIGLFIADFIRWLWNGAGERGRQVDGWDTSCAWCGLIYILQVAPADPKAPPPRWTRCDPARGLGDTLWWCSLRCHVEHWRADKRVDPPPVGEALDCWPEVDAAGEGD